MHHTRKTVKAYNQFNKYDKQNNIACSYCHTLPTRNIIAETGTMVIVENRVPYDFFETRRTTKEHYLVIPKRHVESLEEFVDQEKLDLVTLLATYEAKGFNVYARGVGNMSRSQPHQHTHLIKLVNKRPKLHLFVAKPYFLAHID